ncbi:hypothetical protein M8494_36980 [Serratia ureilytica]
MNAILLGLLLRKPVYATPLGWFTTYLGMVAADLSTGEGWSLALWLNACNMSLIAVGYGIMLMLPQSQRRMGKPRRYSICSAPAWPARQWRRRCRCLQRQPVQQHGGGCLAGLVQRAVFDDLAAVAGADGGAAAEATAAHAGALAPEGLPAFAALLSLVFSVYIGGPGAIAFPIPALLWCAVRYPLFP